MVQAGSVKNKESHEVMAACPSDGPAEERKGSGAGGTQKAGAEAAGKPETGAEIDGKKTAEANAYGADAKTIDGGPHRDCCGTRHKKRSPEDQKKLLMRLRRAEGQIRGIEKMVENDAYCPDILIQVSAVTSALNSFNKELLACHIRGCVVDDIREGKDETIDELCSVMQKLMK